MADPAAILAAARARGWHIATAESCTGGMVAAALTDIAGSSAVFDRGFVTYSNAAKTQMLGVAPDTLATHGAVSEPVAQEMAQGARDRAGVDLAVAITGIAGPGGSDFKPEGRVCFAIATVQGVTAETVEFGALGRDRVRAAATRHALALLARALEA
ncbi:CinA family protein [Aliigemmobacter aestuarii]|uniref:CinA family protein n=1 Tax=Aliigemmobacter aestuarii TaxID=1445661 RepID=A0A4V3V0A4_9RHOB|nr:CinA family protein [Gemmobacter aestuarii]THD83060.1 CinA family protein [Gemmobacter aestuarii]